MSKYDILKTDQDFIGEQTVEQKVIQGIINTRLDQIRLSLPGNGFYVYSTPKVTPDPYAAIAASTKEGDGLGV